LKKPDTPQFEFERLDTLRSLSVLDTPFEERFDRLVRMAKHMFGVPIALVSLVDENRQWFKACIGLSATETPREISFCGHTILKKRVFIVPDATKDKRFADNPLVVNDPKIRFYAGCPLTVNGFRLGTLCIIDQVKRTFEGEDIKALEDLALMAERELAAVHMATMDDLTNISNRRGFMALAQHSINLCLRQNYPVVLVFIDLDKFKLINDTFGHHEGDSALINFTNLLRKELRDSDLFARIGGDEFTLLLSNTSKGKAAAFMIRFSNILKKYNLEMNFKYTLSFSYGIVEFNAEQHGSVEKLISSGDSLMYDVKKLKTS
jgi:diguanylate cyclase (GGDEF)-like protein